MPEIDSVALLDWYRANRRALPWREEITPYRVWISEIMLQQTRVEAVKDYYRRFLDALPTVYDLAAVPDELLMKLWQGLGYYSRARNLKRAAIEIVSRFGGELPCQSDELLTLPGIGRYTAAAIASIAFGERIAAVDGNVLRVYARFTGDESDILEDATKRKFEAAITADMPYSRKNCGDFTQAMIELGATVCSPKGEPRCDACPLREACVARREGRTAELPVKRKKAERRIEERTVLLLRDGDRFGLVKRPDEGLLASLYEPINLLGRLSIEDVCAWLNEKGIRFDAISDIGDAIHIFTHIEWHMHGYLVDISEIPSGTEIMMATVHEVECEYAVPSAYRYFLKKMKEYT